MKFKNLRTVLLVGTMAASLVLNGCGSSTDSSEDATVAEETTETEVIEDEEGEAAEAEESTKEAVVEEVTEKATEEMAEETKEDAIPEWVQNLYDLVIAEDLDAVFEVMEADDFVNKLTVSEDDGYYVDSYDVYTMDDTYVLFLHTCIGSDDGEITVAAFPVEYINGDEELYDYISLLFNDYEDYYFDSVVTFSDEGNSISSRLAIVIDTMYDNYGFEDEKVLEYNVKALR